MNNQNYNNQSSVMPDIFEITGKKVSVIRAIKRITNKSIKGNLLKIALASFSMFAIMAIIVLYPLFIYREIKFDHRILMIQAIKNFIPLFFLFLLGINYLGKTIDMLSRLKHLSDEDYAMLETELSGNRVTKYPGNLYLTDNYIVRLFCYEEFKDLYHKRNRAFFAKYSDIDWVYPTVFKVNGIEKGTGATVWGKNVRKAVILTVKRNNIDSLNALFNHLQQKCPKATFGYSDATKERFRNLM